MDKSLRQQEIVLPTVPVLNVDPRLTDYLQQLHSALTENNRLQQTKVEQFDYSTLRDESTPSVLSYYKQSCWVTGGGTTITNFLQGYHGQIIIIVSEHDVVVQNNSNIHLVGNEDYVMSSKSTLGLMLKSDDQWYELWRNSGRIGNPEILFEFIISASVYAGITEMSDNVAKTANVLSEVRNSHDHSEFQEYDHSITASDSAQKVTMDYSSNQSSNAITSEIVTSVA